MGVRGPDDRVHGEGIPRRGATVVRLIRRIEGLDEVTAEKVAKVLSVLPKNTAAKWPLVFVAGSSPASDTTSTTSTGGS